jgi:hypothetical protein
MSRRQTSMWAENRAALFTFGEGAVNATRRRR